MGWIIVIILVVVLFKNAGKILSALENHFQRKADELDEKQVTRSYQNNEMESGKSQHSTKQYSNISQTILNNNELLSQIAELVVKYATPFVACVKKNYPETSSIFYGFFPLAFIADLFDMLSINDDHALVYALEREIEERENYSDYIGNSTSYDDCTVLKMGWSEGIWNNYLQAKGTEKDRERVIPLVFVHLLNVTAVRDGKIDKNMVELVGVSLRMFRDGVQKLLQ